MAATLNGLSIAHSLPLTSMIEIIPKQVTLPGDSSGKSVVFDLDETLVHATAENPDFSVSVQIPERELVELGVKIRPFARECLAEVSAQFEVIVFTASHKNYADAVLDHLDPTGTLISHRLYKDHCVLVNNVVVKDLRVLVNRRLENVVIIDNMCTAFASQIDNGIPIASWYGDQQDRELIHLMGYLKKLNWASDVREVNRRRFGLCSYGQGIQSISLNLN